MYVYLHSHQQSAGSGDAAPWSEQESAEDPDVPPEQSGAEAAPQQDVTHERGSLLRTHPAQGETCWGLFDIVCFNAHKVLVN